MPSGGVLPKALPAEGPSRPVPSCPGYSRRAAGTAARPRTARSTPSAPLRGKQRGYHTAPIPPRPPETQAPTPAHRQGGEALRGALTARHRPGHIGHEDIEAAPCPPSRPHRAGRRHLVLLLLLLRPPPARPGCAPRPTAAPGPKWRRRRRWAGRAGRTPSGGSFASTGGGTPPSCAACSISPRRGGR